MNLVLISCHTHWLVLLYWLHLNAAPPPCPTQDLFFHLNSCEAEFLLCWFCFVFCLSLTLQSVAFFILLDSFSYSFPLWFIIRYSLSFPMLYSRTLLLLCSVYNSLYHAIDFLIPRAELYIPPQSDFYISP